MTMNAEEGGADAAAGGKTAGDTATADNAMDVEANDEAAAKPSTAAAATENEGTTPMETTTAATEDATNNPPAQQQPRTSLNGCWILDKSQGNWSMRGYLEAMDVNELAIKAHEKGEQEYDTFHTIALTGDRVKITKRSRVNADLVVDLPLGIEQVEYLPPGDRPKKSYAVSNNPTHLQIESSLHTVNGVAKVTDIKHLLPAQDNDPAKVKVVQTLTIVNDQTGNKHTTTRYFIPYQETPPHEVPN